MASTARVIDVGKAIASGSMPGAFNADRTVFSFPRLTYLAAGGARRFWTIRVRLLQGDAAVPITAAMLSQPAKPLAGHRGEIVVEALQEGGKTLPAQPTYVAEGKNLGKRNATNAASQALRDALGLYNKQKRRTATIASDTKSGPLPNPERQDRATVVAKAAPELPPPMLASEPARTRGAILTPADFKAGVTIQRKLNGVRQVAFLRRTPGAAPELVRYSRSGELYIGHPGLAAELSAFLAAAPVVDPVACGVPAAAAAAYAGATPYLDGELYVHGKSLNWISGQARRSAQGPGEHAELEFHVFDVFFPQAIAKGHNMASRGRQAYLTALFAGRVPPHVRRVESLSVASDEGIEQHTRAFRRQGYEGAIVRRDAAPYEYSLNGHRSADLIKKKPTFDAEFKVVGYTQGKRGKDVGAVLWICEVAGTAAQRDREFTVTPKDMSYDERKRLFACLGQQVAGADGKKVSRFERDLKGAPLTVQYQELSPKTGIPLRAKALAFRTYEAGPIGDPARALFAECLGR